MHWLWNVWGWNKKWLDSTTSQTRGLGWVIDQKMVSDDILFHLSPKFSPLPHGPKITKLRKIYILTRNYSLLEINYSPIWRNTLVHILLDNMTSYPVWFTMLVNFISSNISTHMVVPFIGYYPKSLMILTVYQVKWWWTMILSPVPNLKTAHILFLPPPTHPHTRTPPPTYVQLVLATTNNYPLLLPYYPPYNVQYISSPPSKKLTHPLMWIPIWNWW